MTSGDEPSAGEVERVPLKVVPIFVQPVVDEPLPAEEPEYGEVVEDEAAPKRRSVLPAVAAVLLTLATIGVHVSAIVVATAGQFVTGTILGYVAVGLSVVAVVLGVVAAILGRGRAWGIAAAVIAVLVNPLVLLAVLRFLSA